MNSKSNLLSISAIIALSLEVACAQAPKAAEFCLVGQAPGNAVVIDLKKRLVKGVDSVSTMQVVETGPYVGIIFPIPMMVPSSQVSRRKFPLVWRVGGYEFLAQSSVFEPKWLLVTAKAVHLPPELKALSRTKTTFLYSVNSGVIAFQEIHLMDGKYYIDEYYLCGGARLRLTDLLKP